MSILHRLFLTIKKVILYSLLFVLLCCFEYTGNIERMIPGIFYKHLYLKSNTAIPLLTYGSLFNEQRESSYLYMEKDSRDEEGTGTKEEETAGGKLSLKWEDGEESVTKDSHKSMENFDFAEEAIPVYGRDDVVSFYEPIRQNVLNLLDYEPYENLIHNFYVIDQGCMGGSDLFNVEDLSDRSRTKLETKPVILLYHTHSKEKYRAEKEEGGVLEVGDYLKMILEEEYGYKVIHCKEEFDSIRDEAYSKSLPEVEKILKDNPDINVIIDLHRDAGNGNRENVFCADGIRYAKFMFFNGISRSKNTGDIAYLQNDNLKDNLAFSFQMQKTLMEYYPGLAKNIYIKQYRYNMHLLPRTLLIELGDENNTVEEAKNSCYPIAFALSKVLLGEE